MHKRTHTHTQSQGNKAFILLGRGFVAARSCHDENCRGKFLYPSRHRLYLLKQVGDVVQADLIWPQTLKLGGECRQMRAPIAWGEIQ